MSLISRLNEIYCRAFSGTGNTYHQESLAGFFWGDGAALDEEFFEPGVAGAHLGDVEFLVAQLGGEFERQVLIARAAFANAGGKMSRERSDDQIACGHTLRVKVIDNMCIFGQ